jgi:uncharacterized protein YndB with AHSA1/START domain
MHTADNSDREITITRMVDAPREKVWEAFTKEEHLRNWWGPNGFSITTKEFEMKEGGIWRFTMHGPDGRDYPNHIVFTKFIEPKLIAHDHGGDDGKVHFQATITLEESGGKTNVIMKSVFPTPEALKYVIKEHGAIEGGKQTLGRLAEYVPTLL